ncbi:MAG TPA: hypothetical protein VKQ32_24770 [Polyangia bacterium]|nr:hypothetical protein [Polyangia bacterium]
MARGFAWVLASLCLLLLLLAVGLPLLVRGPLLARLVQHESKDLCGSVHVDGGHVSAGLAWALLRQRAFDVVVDGPRIREPGGHDMFRARIVRARVAVHRHPWRVVVEHVLVSDGTWQLVDEGLGAPITQALRKIPHGGRDACRIKPQPEAPRERGVGSVITVERADFQRMSVLLSFPMWEVALPSIDAHGTVELRNVHDWTQILFEARDIESGKGGTLRVGPRTPSTPVMPFDHVDIPRVAVTADAPQDLLLWVTEARTADAVLSGQARFTNVFAPVQWPVSPGTDLDARWTDLGRPLERIDRWAEVGQGLTRERATLTTSLHGSWDALTGVASLRGEHFSLRADLLPHGRYALDVGLDSVDTTPFLPAERRDLLAGRLDGRLAVTAQIDPRSGAGPAVSLDDVELQLKRARAGRGGDSLPRRLVVSRSFRPRSADELRLDLGEVDYGDDGGRIDAFRLATPWAQLAGRARVERHAGSGAMTVRVWSQPGSRFALQGETFLPPALLTAHVEPGGGVVVDPFSVQHVGAGAIDAGGKLHPDGRVDLKLAVRAYPLAHIPGLAAKSAPGRGRSATIGGTLRGQLDAAFAIAGRPQRPALSGTLALSRVGWAGHDLGGGRVDFAGLPGGTRFRGQLLDGIGVSGTLHPALKAEDEVTVALRSFSLGPWLAPRLRPLDPRASGEFKWKHDGEREDVHVLRLVVTARGAQAETAGTLRIDPSDPGATPLDATVTARVDGRALAGVLSPKLTGAGSAGIDASIGGTIAAPRVRGQFRLQGLTVNGPQSPFGAVRLDGALSSDGRTLAVGPLRATFQSGGFLQIGGPSGSGSGKVVLARPGASLPVSNVDVAVRASRITTARPIGGLSLHGLSLGVRLTQPNAVALKADGWVYLGQDFFQLNHDKEKKQEPKPKKEPKEKPTSPSPSFADNFFLHLKIVGPKDAMKIGIPYAPDVTVDPNCLVEGSLASPHLSGEVKGDGLYSKAALAVADWFSSRDLRTCDLGPH